MISLQSYSELWKFQPVEVCHLHGVYVLEVEDHLSTLMDKAERALQEKHPGAWLVSARFEFLPTRSHPSYGNTCVRITGDLYLPDQSVAAPVTSSPAKES